MPGKNWRGEQDDAANSVKLARRARRLQPGKKRSLYAISEHCESVFLTPQWQRRPFFISGFLGNTLHNKKNQNLPVNNRQVQIPFQVRHVLRQDEPAQTLSSLHRLAHFRSTGNDCLQTASGKIYAIFFFLAGAASRRSITSNFRVSRSVKPVSICKWGTRSGTLSLIIFCANSLRNNAFSLAR